MDSRLNENEAEFGVAIFAVDFEMLADGYCLFDEVIKIFGNGWRKSVRLENAENFVTSDKADLGNAMRVSQKDTNL